MRGRSRTTSTTTTTAEQYVSLGTLEQGIPPVPMPDISSGRVPLPRGIFMRSPEPERRRPRRHPAVERGLRAPAAVGHRGELAYVGTRRRRRLRRPQPQLRRPGGGNARGSTSRWPAPPPSTTGRRGPRAATTRLQVAINRPFKNGLLLKGAYTLSKAKNMADEDGWVGLPWNRPLEVDDNFALAGFDRTHDFQMGFLYDLPFVKNSERAARGDRAEAGSSTGSSPPTRGRRSRSPAPTRRSTARAARRSAR